MWIRGDPCAPARRSAACVPVDARAQPAAPLGAPRPPEHGDTAGRGSSAAGRDGPGRAASPAAPDSSGEPARSCRRRRRMPLLGLSVPGASENEKLGCPRPLMGDGTWGPAPGGGDRAAPGTAQPRRARQPLLSPVPLHQTHDIKRKITKFLSKPTFLPPAGSFLQGARRPSHRSCRSGSGSREPGTASEGSRGARHLHRRGAGRAVPSAGPVVPVRLRCPTWVQHTLEIEDDEDEGAHGSDQDHPAHPVHPHYFQHRRLHGVVRRRRKGGGARRAGAGSRSAPAPRRTEEPPPEDARAPAPRAGGR